MAITSRPAAGGATGPSGGGLLGQGSGGPRTPAPVRLLNRVGRRLGGGGPLRAEAFVDRARRAAGLSDFGERGWEEPLGLLIDALEREADLSPLGRRILARMLTRDLTLRLRIVEALRRAPAVATAPVERPLFVVGLPRTGTTLLYSLLARTPGARPLLGWEAHDPVGPRPGRPDRRVGVYGAQVTGMNYVAPDLRKVHLVEARGLRECWPLLNRSLVSGGYLVLANVPSYERWLWDAGPEVFAASYRLHRDQLRLLQAQRPVTRPTSRPTSHWVLKSPVHLASLDALLAVYPDARIVQTHRDLTRVLPSNCSLFTVSRGICSAAGDPLETGRQVLERSRRTLERSMATRARAGDARFFDVRYADLTADPIGTVRAALAHFGGDLPAAAEGRLRGHLADNPQHKHGAHRYTLEQFGLDRAEVERAARDYHERFAVPTEAQRC